MLPLGLLMSDLLGWQPLVVEAKFNKELLTLGMLNLIFFPGNSLSGNLLTFGSLNILLLCISDIYPNPQHILKSYSFR